MKSQLLIVIALGTAMAQAPNPVQEPGAVSRAVKAVNYHHRTGATHIDFRGTGLMPAAKGGASAQSQMGSTKIETTLDHMTPANQFGAEYMTYVLWGVTPEGRAKLLSTTALQSFGLIVTAEPYFAATQPSDVVVAESLIRHDTTGTIQPIDAKYDLLQRGQYALNRSQYRPVRINPKGPLQPAEAENAVEIARLAGAGEYAPDTLQEAQAEADRANQAAQQAEEEKTQLRERLRERLNSILETRETARGLIVEIKDVFFDFKKYTLKPGAREKLAKVAGILLAYPGLRVQLEGHTDSIGTPDYNRKLSRERADAVRDYLAAQGVPADSLTAAGLGESDPVASNGTPAGRQQNRRVEMVVSGEPIGVETMQRSPGAEPNSGRAAIAPRR